MKTFFSQNRILIWILFALLVINIVAISSIIYYANRQKNIISEVVPSHLPARGMMHSEGRYMKEYLGLNEEQMVNFRDARFEFHQQAQQIAFELREKRMELLNELKKDSFDQQKVDSISREIGQLHTKLNSDMSKYYLDVKKICHPEQRERLHNFFINTLENDENMPPHMRNHMRPGRGMRHMKNNIDQNQ